MYTDYKFFSALFICAQAIRHENYCTNYGMMTQAEVLSTLQALLVHIYNVLYNPSILTGTDTRVSVLKSNPQNPNDGNRDSNVIYIKFKRLIIFI